MKRWPTATYPLPREVNASPAREWRAFVDGFLLGGAIAFASVAIGWMLVQAWRGA